MKAKIKRFLHVAWLEIKWQLGRKGKPCGICSFYHLTHHNHKKEFDINDYPCDQFRPTRCNCCRACKLPTPSL